MARIAGQPSNTDFLHHAKERSSEEVTMVVSPTFDRKGKRRHELFEVRPQGHRELVCISAQPMLDCSRILLRAGFKDSAMLKKVRADSPNVVSMRAIADALSKHGRTPVVVRTGSGHFHAYYRHNSVS